MGKAEVYGGYGSTENPTVEVTHITVQERDNLRRFNADMREVIDAFLKVGEVIPLDQAAFLRCCYEAARLKALQQIAGIK